MLGTLKYSSPLLYFVSFHGVLFKYVNPGLLGLSICRLCMILRVSHSPGCYVGVL